MLDQKEETELRVDRKRVQGYSSVMSRYVLDHAGTQISYQVRPPGKRTRRLAIYVHPDGRVRVTAPRGVSRGELHDYVQSQAGWILKQLKRFSDKPVRQEFLYLTGEQHYYLGRLRTLDVREDLLPGVSLEGDTLRVYSTDSQAGVVKVLLQNWYHRRADEVLAQRMRDISANLPWVRTQPIWRHRRMKSQWGSCSARGRISLNTHLVKAPLDCIDSVIIHELCHLQHHNHGKAFKRLIDTHTPDAKACRDRLNALAGIILAH